MTIDWLEEALQQVESQGLRRGWKTIRPLADGWCEWQGRRLRNFAGNDYLNLACDPRLATAFQAVATTSGVGATASALVSGRSPWHETLEREIATWMHSERALLFPTGFAANVGTICALVGKGDAVFSDALNHASLIDGCRLSGAQTFVYPHQDLEELRSLLIQHPARRRLVVTDTLFSMEGNTARLRELVRLCEEQRVPLMIDEAHAIGTRGATGGGISEEFDLRDRIAVRVGTLSKSVGCLGGFVVGSTTLVEWLWNRARPQIFSTALPPGLCAAASEAIRILQSEPDRRTRLDALSLQLREGLRGAGFDVGLADRGPIVPVVLNSPWKAVRVAERLAEQGYLVGAIRPPSVPAGTSRLRLTLSCAFTAADIDGLLAAIHASCREL